MKKIIETLKEDWIVYAIILLIAHAALTKNSITLLIALTAYVSLFLAEIRNEVKNKK